MHATEIREIAKQKRQELKSEEEIKIETICNTALLDLPKYIAFFDKQIEEAAKKGEFVYTYIPNIGMVNQPSWYNETKLSVFMGEKIRDHYRNKGFDAFFKHKMYWYRQTPGYEISLTIQWI
jgi:hypothetical protein